ncbi:MAG: HNH endonuclease signature motif containing protein [Verrucomicrobiales bacterium]
MNRRLNTPTRGGSFNPATIEAVWRKAKPEPGRPGFVRDTCGALIQHADYGQETTYGWHVDHIVPVAKGGGDELSNLQPLHWENNLHKGTNYPNWSCKRSN